MRYVVTGATGMLGSEIVLALAGRDVTALSHADLDITDADAVGETITGFNVVINAAAYTDVEGAEAEPELAADINANGAANLAWAANAEGARFVQVSTDYVFHGDATSPYAEDEPPAPINTYGRSKAEGERLATREMEHGLHIVRTAWLYGTNGTSFPATIARRAREGQPLRVIDTQRGQPTWARDVAQRIVEMLDAEVPPGIYHATSTGEATWYEFAREVLAASGLDPELIERDSSTEQKRAAVRPGYTVLGHAAWEPTGLPPLRDWREALREAVAEGVLEPR